MPYVRVGDVDEWRWGEDDSPSAATVPEVPADRTRAELVEEARVVGIKGAARMSKAELEEALGGEGETEG